MRNYQQISGELESEKLHEGVEREKVLNFSYITFVAVDNWHAFLASLWRLLHSTE